MAFDNQPPKNPEVLVKDNANYQTFYVLCRYVISIVAAWLGATNWLEGQTGAAVLLIITSALPGAYGAIKKKFDIDKLLDAARGAAVKLVS